MSNGWIHSSFCLAVVVLVAVLGLPVALASGPAPGTYYPTHVSGVVTVDGARRATIHYAQSPLTAGAQVKTVAQNITISPESMRAAARGAMRLAGPISLGLTAAELLRGVTYDPETMGIDTSAGEWLQSRVERAEETYTSGLPPPWQSMPSDCYTIRSCTVLGQGTGQSRHISYTVPWGPNPLPSGSNPCSSIGGINIGIPAGIACLVQYSPPHPTTVAQWNASFPITIPAESFEVGNPFPAEDSVVDGAIDDRLAMQLIAAAIQQGFSNLMPEIWDMANSLNSWLDPSAPGYDPVLDGQTKIGAPVVPVSGIDPPVSSDGGAGGEIHLEFPIFCQWATIVCDFIEWFRSPADEPESVDVPIEDVDIPDGVDLGGSYTCPPDRSVTVMGTVPIVFSYGPICDAGNTYGRPVIMLCASLASLLIIIGGARV